MSENITMNMDEDLGYEQFIEVQEKLVVEPQEPVLLEPQEPQVVVEEPQVVVEEPVVVKEPVVVEEPVVVVVEEPVVVVEEPVVVVEEPVVVVEEPVVVVEEPVVVVEEPQVVVEEPVVVVEEPVVEEPEEAKINIGIDSSDIIKDQYEEPIVEQIPEVVFIVPYRDRKQHYNFFSSHMKLVLMDMTNYKMLYVHQTDKRDFNRGAMKNIGFLTVKDMYPNDYKNITLVFNDIDTMPYSKNFLNYTTELGTIKHYYGFTWALGGILSIKAADFEKINGYPNFWAWGYEDNLLNTRALQNKLNIDRTQFYPIMDKNILQLKDGITRIVNRTEFDNYMDNTSEGINTINELQYNYDKTNGFVNVINFSTGTAIQPEKSKEYKITQNTPPFSRALPPSKPRGRFAGSMKMVM
jgi:hypothetical protein